MALAAICVAAGVKWGKPKKGAEPPKNGTFKGAFKAYASSAFFPLS